MTLCFNTYTHTVSGMLSPRGPQSTIVFYHIDDNLYYLRLIYLIQFQLTHPDLPLAVT